jgi:hypothetical protein
MINQPSNAEKERQYFISLNSNELKKLESITIVICVDNSAFWGNQLKTLIDEINGICHSENSKLRKVNFVDTTYLNRHYDKKYDVPHNSQWKTENLKYIKSLIIDHDCIDWISYLNDERYKGYEIDFQKNYETNFKGFRDICDNFAKIFAHKNGLEAAKNYFLEESIAFRLKQGVILYPGKLKDPFEWIMKNYSDSKVSIFPYTIKPIKIKNINESKPSKRRNEVNHDSNGNYQPTFFGMAIAGFADKVTKQNTKKQLDFMQRFVQLCNEFSDSSSDSDDEDKTDRVSVSRLSMVQ